MATVETPVRPWDRDESQRRVTHPLQRLRGYIRSYVSLEGLAILGLYLALWFWIGLAIDFGFFKVFKEDLVQVLPFALRAVVFGGLVAGLLAVVATKVFLRLFREFGNGPLALVLERRFPEELGDRLITAVELADPRKSERYGYSQQMVDQTIQEAAERIYRLPVTEAFNWRRLRRYAVRVLALTLGLYVLVGAAYCGFRWTGPLNFMRDFNNVAAIWFERNILLEDTLWPRRAYLELVDFPPSGDLRVGRDAPPPSLRVRALKWVIADRSAAEGWRALTWRDLTPELLDEQGPAKLPEHWQDWTVDQIEQAVASNSDQGIAGMLPGVRGVFHKLEEQAASPHMARRMRKLIVPDVVVVKYKGATVRSEQSLKKEAGQEYSGILSDLKESVRFTVNGEDYWTPYKKITIVPPPSLMELSADKEEPAYLHQRPPAGGTLSDLLGKKQIFRDIPVSLSGAASRIDPPAGTNLVLRGKIDKPLRTIDGLRMRLRDASTAFKGDIKVFMDSQTNDVRSFEVRFNNLIDPQDFVLEMIDTDNVVGLRQVIIKPIEDTPPEVDEEVEVIRKTNQGYMVTPRCRIPFSGKIRDDHGLNTVEFHYTLSSIESQAAQNASRVASVLGLAPHHAGSAVLAPGYLDMLGGLLRLSDADAGKTAQKAPLAAFAKRMRELAAEDVSRDQWDARLLTKPEATLLRDHTLDPQDEKETSFDVEKLGLLVTDEKQVQPRYRMRLWIVATDNNVETGPGVGQSKEKHVFLIVSEFELLLEIAKVEESLHVKLEDAVGKLRDAKLKLEQVNQELPELKAKEFSPMALRLGEIEETLNKSWDVSREVLTDYQRILKELQVNQVRAQIIQRVEGNICLPLADTNNHYFDLTDKALAAFQKTLEDQKKDIPAAQAADKQLQDLIDRLTKVLDAMADITTINKLIELLTHIRDEQNKATEHLRQVHAEKVKNLLEEQFGTDNKPPDKKEKK